MDHDLESISQPALLGMPHPGDKLFHVRPGEAGQTVAAMLRGRVAGTAWSQVQRLLRNRHVLVNGNLCLDAGRRLKATDVVKLLEHPTAPLPRADDVRIRYLDQHLVVVEKPSGITSVRHAEERDWSPQRRQQQPTLEDLLPRLIAKRLAAGDKRSSQRPGRQLGGPPRGARTPPVRPVHRLDRDTSGLMVFARTVPAERHLGAQFRAHTTARRYLAVAVGRVPALTIDNRLVRDRGDGRRGSTTDPAAGKRAVTHLRPLEQLGDYTLVECRLETGRTHQIRIHLAELGHPLCGETVYHRARAGAAPTPRAAAGDASGAPRLALHAAELEFEHPATGRRMQFEMALPADLQAFIGRLRRAAARSNKSLD